MASNIAELFQSPDFLNAPVGERRSMIAGVMDQGILQARALNDPQLLDDMYTRKRELLREAGMSQLPGDIGAVENFNNAAARSFSGFKTSIGLELLKQDHQAAKDYDEEIRRIYPVREEGISDDIGSATASIVPSALAIGTAFAPGAMIPLAARVAVGAFYGAAAAGSKRGDIEEHEALTGEEVGSVRAGVAMTGAAMVEIGTELMGMEILSRGITGIARRGFNKAAVDAVGAAAVAKDTGAYKAAITRAFWEEPATRKATLAALGWVGAGGVEGLEEMVSQFGQNMTDWVFKPWDDLEPTKDVVASFKGGFIGGLLLGPLAMTVQGTRMSQFKDSQRAAEADALSALKLTDKAGNQIDPQHDPSAWDSPAFGSVKQRLGQVGLELYPVTGLPENRGMTARVDETGRRVVLVDRKQAGDDAFYKVIGHEFGHGLDDLMGRESAVALKRSILEAVPEYRNKYQQALGEDADPVRDDLVVEEQFADLFAEHWLDPRLQQRVAELASEKPGKMGGLFASLKQKYSGQFSIPAERMRDMSREMARQAAEFAPGDTEGEKQHRAAQSLFEQANIAFEQGRKVEAALEQMAQMEAAMRLARRNQPDNLARMRAEAQRILDEQKAAEVEAAKPKAEPAVELPEPPMPPSPEPEAQETSATPAPTPSATEIVPGFTEAYKEAVAWDFANRTRRSDEWFEGARVDPEARRGYDEALLAGGDQLQAHGMTKEGTLSGGFRNLLNILKNGLDPDRRNGMLDTAPLVNRPGEGLVGATPSGGAYTDGPFTLVARPGEELSGNLSGLGAIVINQANASQAEAMKRAFLAVRPDLLVGTPSELKSIVTSLLSGKAAPTSPEPKISSPANFTGGAPWALGSDEVLTPRGGLTVQFDWDIVERKALRTSNNGGYLGSLQERMREKQASKENVLERRNNFDVRQAHASAYTSQGAPLTALLPDTEAEGLFDNVVSGNGRTLSIDDLPPQLRANYDAMLRFYGERIGKDPSKMEDPRLIRRMRRSDLTFVERVAELSNRDEKEGRSPAETAQGEGRALARRLDILRLFDPAGGNLNAQANREFLNRYAKEIAFDEGVFSADRKTFEAVDRLQNALIGTLLAGHPNSAVLLRKIIEANGVDSAKLSKIATELGRAAPDLLTLPGEFALAYDMAEGLNLIATAIAKRVPQSQFAEWIEGRRIESLSRTTEGKPVVDPMHVAMTEMLFNAAPGEIKDFAERYNKQAAAEMQGGFFGMRSREELVLAVRSAQLEAKISDASKTLEVLKLKGKPEEIAAQAKVVEALQKQRKGKRGDEPRFSPASRMNDAAYLAAVEAGDMATAQRMVDEAAKAAGFRVERMYHGTKAESRDFTVFRTEGGAKLGAGAYFTPYQDVADRYDSEGAARAFYLRADLPGYDEYMAGVPVDLIGKVELPTRGESDNAAWAVFAGDVEVAVRNPDQIKSADPVTRDDAGNVIPLSQRFQPASPDIRFSPAAGALGGKIDAVAARYAARERALLEKEAVRNLRFTVGPPDDPETGNLLEVYPEFKHDENPNAMGFVAERGGKFVAEIRNQTDTGSSRSGDGMTKTFGTPEEAAAWLQQELRDFADHDPDGKRAELLREAKMEMIGLVVDADWGKGITKPEMEEAGTGSLYVTFETDPEYDEDGDLVDSGATVKYSIRDHEPSVFREREFGANNAWFDLGKEPTLEKLAEAAKWLARRIDARAFPSDEPRFSPAGRFTDPGSPTWRGGHLHSIRQARADLPDAEAIKQIALPPGVTFSGWDANGKGTMTYADKTTEEFQLGPDWREGITQAENRAWSLAFSVYADPSVEVVLGQKVREAAEAWYADFRPRVAPEMRDAVQAAYDKAVELHSRVNDITLMRWMRSNVGRTLNNFVEERLASIQGKAMIRGSIVGKAIQRAAKQPRSYYIREILRQVFPGRDLSQMTQALRNLASKETELRAGVVVPIRQYVEKLPPVRDLDPSTMLRIAERIDARLEEYRFTTPFSRDQRPWEEQKRVFIEEFLQDVRRGADQKLGFQDMYAYFDAMVRVIGTDHATYFRTGMGGGSINDNTQYAPDYAQGSGAASVVQDLMRAREEMTSEEEWAGAIAEAEAELTRDYGWTKQRVDEAVDGVIEYFENGNREMLLSLTRWMQEQDAPRMSPAPRLREIRTSEQIRAGNRGYSWAGYKARYQIPEGDAAKVARVWSELKFDDPGMTPEMREQMLRDWRFSGDFLRLADLVTARTILLRLADSAITDAEYTGTTATPEMVAAKNRAQLDFNEVADIQSAAGKTLRMANTQSVDTSLMPQLDYFQRFAKPINAVAAVGGKDAEIDAQLEAAKTLANVLGTETAAAIENDDLARDAELGRRTREAFASDDLDLQDKLIAELRAQTYRTAGEQFDVGDADFAFPDESRLSPAPVPKFSAWLVSVLSDPARVRRIHAAFQNNDTAYLANFTRLTDAQRGLLAQAAADIAARMDAARASRKAQTTKANPGREAIAEAAKNAAMSKAKAKKIAKLTADVVRSANSEFTLRVARALPGLKNPMDSVNLALDNTEEFALAVERGATAFRLKWAGKEVSDDDLAMGATILHPGLLDTKDDEGDVLRAVTHEELNFILRTLDNDVAANRARGFALAPVQTALGVALAQAKIKGDALRTGKFDRAAIIDAVLAQVSPVHQERVRPVAERELQIMTETANDAAYDRALAAAARADLRLRGLLAPVAKPEGAITPAEVARAIIAGARQSEMLKMFPVTFVNGVPTWESTQALDLRMAGNWEAAYAAAAGQAVATLNPVAGDEAPAVRPNALLPTPLMLSLVSDAMEADKLTPADFAALSPDSPRLAGIVGKLASNVSSDERFVAFADAFVRNLHAQRKDAAELRTMLTGAGRALRERIKEKTGAKPKDVPNHREAAVRRLLNDEALLTRVLEEQIEDLKRHGHEAYGMTPEQMQEHLDLVVNDLNLLQQRAVERAGLSKLVADAMAEAEITYRDIMLGGIRVHGQTMQSVGDAVAKRLGISKDDVATRTKLNNAVQSLIDGNLATAKTKAKQRVLDAHTKDRKVRPESLPYEKLVGLWRMGFLDDTVALQTISAKLLGLPELTDAQIAEIRQIVNQIEVTLSAVDNDPTHVFVKMRWEALDRVLSNWVDAFDTSLKGRAKDAFKVAQAAFTLNLVSGPGTLLVTNPLGNLGQVTLELFMEANRQAKAGKLTTADYLKGVLSIAKDAATAAGASAVDAFTTGVVVERLGEKWDGLSVIERREFSGALKVLTAGGLIKYVGRVLAAGDTAFYAFAKDAGMFMNEMRRASEAGLSVEEAAAQARRNIGRDPGGMDKFMQQARDQAARAGVQGEAVIRQAATQLRDSALRAMPGGAESVERGNDMGRKSTYTHETDGFFSHFARKFLNPLLQELPVVRFVTPFTGIVATVADTSMEYFAPYAIWNVYKKRGHAAKILAGKTAEQLNELDSAAYNEALRATQRAQQQMIIGTTTTLLAILAALMGGDDDEEGIIIWGAGPKDFAKNAAWRETGARPYSIRIGGRVVSYQLSPLFLALAAVGNVRDARHYEVDPEVGLASVTLHSGLIATAATTTLGQSYLKGVSDLFEMLTERDPKRRSEKAQELVSMVTTSTFIPFANAFRQTYKMIDPTGKVTNREFVKQTQAQMGPLSAGLTRRQNVLGSEVQFDRPIFDTLPFIATPDPAENEEDQRVLRFLASRDVWLSMPSSARTQLLVRGDVTKAEYKRLEATHGGAVMDEAQFYTFMKKRGERFKSAFTPLLATLEGADPELVKEVADRVMDVAQTQARRETLGLAPLAARDRALRQAIAARVREATR